MSSRRVVITGIGLVSPLGNHLDELMENLYQGKSASRINREYIDTWGLATALDAPVCDFKEETIGRKLRRSMSRVAMMATEATGRALADADLSDDLVQSDRMGISYGSTMGGLSSIEEYFGPIMQHGAFEGIMSGTFPKIMSHTCAANLALAFSIPGRVVASCCACAASTQSIGYGYEAIKHGYLDRAVCGGAEELHVSMVGVFDVLRSTSLKYNDSPSLTPRPFDRDRDGIVIGEGAGTLILEERGAALKRGAQIYAEITGFYTNNDSAHMTNPSKIGLQRSMAGALANAGLKPGDIDHVNAHSTGTLVGDIAESVAIHNLLGKDVPVSSMKGHLGHLMGGCGAIESIVALGMIRDESLVPTLNLENIDPKCANLNYQRGEVGRGHIKNILKNSFAFGGINASIIYTRSN